jgi:hypothetical protein
VQSDSPYIKSNRFTRSSSSICSSGHSPTARQRQELRKKKVKLRIGGSVRDPTDPVGRLLFNFLAMVTAFESDLTFKGRKHHRQTLIQNDEGVFTNMKCACSVPELWNVWGRKLENMAESPVLRWCTSMVSRTRLISPLITMRNSSPA